MKILLSCVFLMACISSFSQEIPKKANLILIHDITLKEIGNRLLDSGFTLKKIDTNFQTIETEAREQYHNSGLHKIIFIVRIKDGIAELKGFSGTENNGTFAPGTFGAQMSGVDIPISNDGLWRKNKYTPFNIMNRFALSFGKQTEYKTQ